MFRLTLGSLTISDASMPDIVAAAAEAGFVGCGMRVTGRRVDDPTPTVVGNPALVRSIKERLKATGIMLSSVAAYHFTPELRVSDFAPVIDIAAELGARTFGVACQDPDEGRFVEKLAEFAGEIEKIKARVAIELMPYSQARTIEQTKRLVERTGKPNVGFNLDSLHIFRSGATAADVKSVAPERVFIVQISDAPRTLAAGMDLPTESRTSRLYPGLGGLPLYDFLDAIPQDRDVIECETPYAPHRHLPAGERAKLTAAAMREFLKKYLRERRPMKAAPSD